MENIEIIWDKIRETVSGKGIYSRNREIGLQVQQLWYDHGVSREDIVQEAMTTILVNDVMDRYDTEHSLGWFITGVVWRVIRNIRKRIEHQQECEQAYVRHYEVFGQRPDDPEQLYLASQVLDIAKECFTEIELEYLMGKIDADTAASELKISKKSFWQQISRHRDKALNLLQESCYEDDLAKLFSK